MGGLAGLSPPLRLPRAGRAWLGNGRGCVVRGLLAREMAAKLPTYLPK